MHSILQTVQSKSVEFIYWFYMPKSLCEIMRLCKCRLRLDSHTLLDEQHWSSEHKTIRRQRGTDHCMLSYESHLVCPRVSQHFPII